MGRRVARLAAAIGVLVALVAWPSLLGSAQTSTTAPSTTSTTTSTTTTSTTTAPTATTSAWDEIQDARLDSLRDRQDDTATVFNFVLVPLAIIVTVLGAGGVVGIVLSFRNEVRAGQIHDLQIAGESAQQARTEETHAVLLDASQKTLTLVNDTLELARDASDRAAKELTHRAERLLNEITEDANNVFVNSHYAPEFERKALKVLVEVPRIRNDLRDLAQRIASIEGYLEFQEIPLSASAFVVKGMDHHLRQDEDNAIKCFGRAVAAPGGTNSKVLQYALFWMGYSCNNVGRYTQAADVFHAAARHADAESPLAFDLGRMEEESRFFELAQQAFDPSADRAAIITKARHVVGRLETQRVAADAVEFTPASQAISTTVGNIHTWIARSDPSVAPDALRDAIAAYRLGGRSLWARFGLAEAERALDPDRPVDLDEYDELERAANDATKQRSEPRSQTLLHLTATTCMVRQDKSPELVSGALRALREAFRDVEGALTLYSQHWKANVSRDLFDQDDIEPLVHAVTETAPPEAPSDGTGADES